MDLTVRNLEILRRALRWYRFELETARVIIREGLLISHGPTPDLYGIDKLIDEVDTLYDDVCAILARRKDPDEAC